ncbi:hypothetical protein Tco_0811669 [Tanacetum coccineum]
MDIYNHAYRWDREPYELVFQLGFEARRQANNLDESYLNLESFVNGVRIPIDKIRDTAHGFISTTLTCVLPMLLGNYKSTWRGAAAFFRQPVNEYGRRLAWCNTVTPPLARITFRNSEGDMDICNHVYRWDREPYELVFQLGF